MPTAETARTDVIPGHVTGVSHVGRCVSDHERWLRFYTEMIVRGSTKLEHTRMHVPVPGGTADVLFLADPDGARIELVPHTATSAGDGQRGSER